MVQTKLNITLQVPKQGIPNSPDSLPRIMKENLYIIVIICKLGKNFQLVSKSKDNAGFHHFEIESKENLKTKKHKLLSFEELKMLMQSLYMFKLV
jgi:hypothetical protein